MVIFLGAGMSFAASPALRDSIYSSSEMISSVDNHLILSSDLDNFNFTAGKDLDFVNRQALRATAFAHLQGGVPNMTISINEVSEQALGQLFYFFMKSAAISGYLLGVNPFDQPGVEAYKSKMSELLRQK